MDHDEPNRRRRRSRRPCCSDRPNTSLGRPRRLAAIPQVTKPAAEISRRAAAYGALEGPEQFPLVPDSRTNVEHRSCSPASRSGACTSSLSGGRRLIRTQASPRASPAQPRSSRDAPRAPPVGKIDRQVEKRAARRPAGQAEGSIEQPPRLHLHAVAHELKKKKDLLGTAGCPTTIWGAAGSTDNSWRSGQENRCRELKWPGVVKTSRRNLNEGRQGRIAAGVITTLLPILPIFRRERKVF